MWIFSRQFMRAPHVYFCTWYALNAGNLFLHAAVCGFPEGRFSSCKWNEHPAHGGHRGRLCLIPRSTDSEIHTRVFANNTKRSCCIRTSYAAAQLGLVRTASSCWVDPRRFGQSCLRYGSIATENYLTLGQFCGLKVLVLLLS